MSYYSNKNPNHYNKKPMSEEKTEIESSIVKKKPGEDMCQWALHGNEMYVATPRVAKRVEAGVYQIYHSQQFGLYIQQQKAILSDEIIDLPITEIREIVEDIDKFWEPSTKVRFKDYNMTYKRGIIVWGPPGNGKSYMMQIIIRNLIKRDGVIFTLDTVDSVERFISFANTFRRVEPDRPLVVILEDIDNVVEAGQSILSALMNVLDGVNQIDNVVYLATTNYPHKLEERISNRPSRFDRKYEIGAPEAEVRKAYILGKMKPEDKKRINVQEWVEKTEGFSLSHIKELIVSVCILGKNLDDVLEHFDDMKKNRSSRSSDLGFKKGNGNTVISGFHKEGKNRT